MRDLIVFGEDYGALPTSTQHLINCLAQTRKVLWVNSIGLRQPKFNLRDWQRAANKLLGRSKAQQFNQTPVAAPENLHVVNVMTIPAPRSVITRRIAQHWLTRQLQPVVKALKLHRPILWTSLPTAVDMVNQLGDRGCVYYCGDDFASLAGVDGDTVTQYEAELVNKADLVLTASDALTAKFADANTVTLTHGVDCQHFSSPAKRAPDLPSRGRPIAGFYGSLSQWLDYELLNKTILALPDWDFVFIGAQEITPFPLVQTDNVHLLGPKPHHLLPQYSQHWQVSLLPFVLNQQILSCNPLKLKEYLATGTPVVSTPFPALKPYQQHIHTAANVEQMVACLQSIKNQPTRLPKGLVEQESWQHKAQQVELLLEAL
ncbi:glycosyltransferase family 1 protein [Vibrio hippocampi]|uniref:Glycosyltransferase family 1 protein n=1 Tax=Vibrio hippocampi TaxID=654686 RepID=A0ABN8DNQ0_9VIBR|nr:glycosyltransferase family 1 protein [Vibrio hippocampi]CAH0529969.1 hypothetical protein VHP8226_03695 [Vibrio hippocampi]